MKTTNLLARSIAFALVILACSFSASHLKAQPQLQCPYTVLNYFDCTVCFNWEIRGPMGSCGPNCCDTYCNGTACIPPASGSTPGKLILPNKDCCSLGYDIVITVTNIGPNPVIGSTYPCSNGCGGSPVVSGIYDTSSGCADNITPNILPNYKVIWGWGVTEIR